MKKLVLLCALVLVAGVCFAQNGDEEVSAPRPSFFNLEISVGVPIHWTNSVDKHAVFGDAYKDRTVTANTAFGAALLFNFGRRMGLTLDGDFFFGTDVMGASNTSSYSNSLFGSNLLLGPVFYLYNSTFLRVPFAIGGYFSYWSSSNWYPFGFNFTVPTTPTNEEGQWVFIRDIQIGPAVYIGMQFHFNNNIYMFSRTNVALTLYSWHKVYADGDNTANINAINHNKAEAVIGWTVKPTLGIGVKF